METNTSINHITPPDAKPVLPAVFPFPEKLCPICNTVKPVEEYHTYYSKERKKYRIGNYCKPCARVNSLVRATKYYEENREEKKEYAKKFRADPKNKDKLKTLSQKFKVKYREELQDCYIRDRLTQDDGIPVDVSKALPEIVETKRLQIKIKRKIKSLKNGKK